MRKELTMGIFGGRFEDYPLGFVNYLSAKPGQRASESRPPEHLFAQRIDTGNLTPAEQEVAMEASKRDIDPKAFMAHLAAAIGRKQQLPYMNPAKLWKEFSKSHPELAAK
jgi:hypothetical protein